MLRAGGKTDSGTAKSSAGRRTGLQKFAQYLNATQTGRCCHKGAARKRKHKVSHTCMGMVGQTTEWQCGIIAESGRRSFSDGAGS